MSLKIVNFIPNQELILNFNSIKFLEFLAENFIDKINNLLQLRIKKQKEYDSGNLPYFLNYANKFNWKVEDAPHDLKKRIVEITGPVERKIIINALNSGADVYMADFEDSLSPTWSNIIDGQINLYDAVRKNILYTLLQRKY